MSLPPRSRSAARPRSRRPGGPSRRPSVERLEPRTLLTTGLPVFTGPFTYPGAITTGPDGNLWVNNQQFTGGGRLPVVAPDGSVKAEYDVPDVGALSAVVPGPDGNLWFSLWATNKVGKITTDGAVVEVKLPQVTIGSVNVRPYASLAVGSDRALWFADVQGTSYTIDRLNADGSVTEFPLGAHADGPQGLTLGPDGALWFAQYADHAVGRITPDGAVTETPIRAALNPSGNVVFDAAGNAWFAASSTGQVETFALVRVTPGGAATEVHFYGPEVGSVVGITRGPDGALGFTDANRGQVARFDPAVVAAPAPADHPLTGWSHGDVPDLVETLHVSSDVFRFFDGNPAGTDSDFSATIDWGDGSTSAGTVAADQGGFTVSGTHDYAAFDSYTVRVAVTDTNPAHTPQPNSLTGFLTLSLLDPKSTPFPIPVVTVPVGVGVAGPVLVSIPPLVTSTAAPTPAPRQESAVGLRTRAIMAAFVAADLRAAAESQRLLATATHHVHRRSAPAPAQVASHPTGRLHRTFAGRPRRHR